MKLFGKKLFGKEKEEEEQQETEASGENEEDPEAAEEAEPQKRAGRKGKGRATGIGERAAANVEKIAAKVEALSELRRADAERFSRISEQIGELRNLILEKEEEIKELGTKATKAAEMVGELQPEKILSEIRKGTTKYEMLEAKIEGTNTLYQEIIEEVKRMRNKLAMFRGTEELMKLNEETAKNLASIKRTEANIESQANKTGNIYVQFQKQANELVKYRDAAAALADEFRNIKKSVEEVKAKAQSALVDQKDLDRLREELLKSISAVQGAPKSAGLPPSGSQKSDRLILGLLNETRRRLEKKDEEARAMKGELAKSQNAIAALQEEMRKLARSFNSEINSIRTRLDKANVNNISKMENQLAAYAMQKKFSEQFVVDTLKEVRERLAKRDEETRSTRAELNSLKERLYETVLELQNEGKDESKGEKHAQPKKQDKKQEQPEQEDVPGMENETVADFESRIEELRQAIQKKNTHTAIVLYNGLRESYVKAAKSGIPESKKYALRSQLLDMHTELSSFINTVTTSK